MACAAHAVETMIAAGLLGGADLATLALGREALAHARGEAAAGALQHFSTTDRFSGVHR